MRYSALFLFVCCCKQLYNNVLLGVLWCKSEILYTQFIL